MDVSTNAQWHQSLAPIRTGAIWPGVCPDKHLVKFEVFVQPPDFLCRSQLLCKARDGIEGGAKYFLGLSVKLAPFSSQDEQAGIPYEPREESSG
jgi:hypothetical protein